MNIDHKFDLIQELRREQERRERSSYGRYVREYQQEEENGNSFLASFRLRMLTAILLFFCFFLMDKKEISFNEIESQKIVECIGNHIVIDDLLNGIRQDTGEILEK